MKWCQCGHEKVFHDSVFDTSCCVIQCSCDKYEAR